jgi:hypothetical protein
LCVTEPIAHAHPIRAAATTRWRRAGRLVDLSPLRPQSLLTQSSPLSSPWLSSPPSPRAQGDRPPSSGLHGGVWRCAQGDGPPSSDLQDDASPLFSLPWPLSSAHDDLPPSVGLHDDPSRSSSPWSLPPSWLFAAAEAKDPFTPSRVLVGLPVELPGALLQAAKTSPLTPTIRIRTFIEHLAVKHRPMGFGRIGPAPTQRVGQTAEWGRIPHRIPCRRHIAN